MSGGSKVHLPTPIAKQE